MSSRDIRIIFVGDTNVGKTSLLNYLTTGHRGKPSPTCGPVLTRASVDGRDHTVRLLIWDTAGQERYNAISPLYYREAHIACICIDLSADLFRDEQPKLEYWKNTVASYEPKCLFVAVGTKADLLSCDDRKKTVQMLGVADRCGIKMCFATSAVNGEGTDGMFDAIARFAEGDIFPPQRAALIPRQVEPHDRNCCYKACV
jgi:small GTP-binding protein